MRYGGNAGFSYSDEDEKQLKFDQRTLSNMSTLGGGSGKTFGSSSLFLERSMLGGSSVGLLGRGIGVISCGDQQLLHIARLGSCSHQDGRSPATM